MGAPQSVADWRRITANIAALIRSGSITTSKIADLAVTTAKIANLAVTTGKIADLAVTNGKIATDAVDTRTILDLSVITDSIADLAVTTAKLDDLAVTTAKIKDGAVERDKIAAGAVTQTATATGGTDDTTTSASYTNIGSMSVTVSSIDVGDSVVVWFSGYASNSSSPALMLTGIRVDSGATVDAATLAYKTNDQSMFCGWIYCFTATATSHLIRARMKTDTGTMTVYAGRVLTATAFRR